MKIKKAQIIIFTMLIFTVSVISVSAQPGFGFLYYNGDIVRTVVPPAAMTKTGIDNLYPVMGGAEGQLAIAAVAPGDTDYHGGKWAVHVVTWNTAPYLLTSEEDVLAAEEAGDVTVSRAEGADFKCPIQP
ncbi:MAG: hypothetical protein AMK71_09275 [Nitrospira bacterium SG8_35_4]|nr:MAG: hypothetical protein AMK71_09275 [Nitrospira bacterium SG8_35_4]